MIPDWWRWQNHQPGVGRADNIFSADGGAVETRGMNRETKTMLAENGVDVLGPLLRGFRVALEVLEDRYDSMSRGNDGVSFGKPPVSEGRVDAHIVVLLGGTGFSKCIGDIRSEHEFVLQGREGGKEHA
jgi:hypothetical protein